MRIGPVIGDVKLNVLERAMFRTYTARERAGDGLYRVVLSIDGQTFALDRPPEPADEADWARAMLARALAHLVLGHILLTASVGGMLFGAAALVALLSLWS